jgi:hypothetical protein
MEISILIILILLILILFNRYQSKSVGINLDEDGFNIPGIFGLRVNYRDIYQIDMISEIPEIGMRTNGYYFRSVCKGFYIKGYWKCLFEFKPKVPTLYPNSIRKQRLYLHQFKYRKRQH